MGWDEQLAGHHLQNWESLVQMLREVKTVRILRCVYSAAAELSHSVRLIGFCDASSKAYAAVVYLRLEDELSVDVKFLGVKTRAAPVGGTTIPQLELLSSLLLAKLITSIAAALRVETPLLDPLVHIEWQFNLEKASWWGGIFK